MIGKAGGDEQPFWRDPTSPATARKLKKWSMSWHHPDTCIFSLVLAGLAALLAIAYELVSRRRKPAGSPPKRASKRPSRS